MQLSLTMKIGGLDAQMVRWLSYLLETLEKYAILLRQDKDPAVWLDTLIGSSGGFSCCQQRTGAKNAGDAYPLINNVGQICEQAGLTASDTLPLNVVREAWLASVDEPISNSVFLSGRVNFCTLMPMRAIPFV